MAEKGRNSINRIIRVEKLAPRLTFRLCRTVETHVAVMEAAQPRTERYLLSLSVRYLAKSLAIALVEPPEAYLSKAS